MEFRNETLAARDAPAFHNVSHVDHRKRKAIPVYWMFVFSSGQVLGLNQTRLATLSPPLADLFKVRPQSTSLRATNQVETVTISLQHHNESMTSQ